MKMFVLFVSIRAEQQQTITNKLLAINYPTNIPIYDMKKKKKTSEEWNERVLNYVNQKFHGLIVSLKINLSKQQGKKNKSKISMYLSRPNIIKFKNINLSIYYIMKSLIYSQLHLFCFFFGYEKSILLFENELI